MNLSDEMVFLMLPVKTLPGDLTKFEKLLEKQINIYK